MQKLTYLNKRFPDAADSTFIYPPKVTNTLCKHKKIKSSTRLLFRFFKNSVSNAVYLIIGTSTIGNYG